MPVIGKVLSVVITIFGGIITAFGGIFTAVFGAMIGVRIGEVLDKNYPLDDYSSWTGVGISWGLLIGFILGLVLTAFFLQKLIKKATQRR